MIYIDILQVSKNNKKNKHKNNKHIQVSKNDTYVSANLPEEGKKNINKNKNNILNLLRILIY